MTPPALGLNEDRLGCGLWNWLNRFHRPLLFLQVQRFLWYAPLVPLCSRAEGVGVDQTIVDHPADGAGTDFRPAGVFFNRHEHHARHLRIPRFLNSTGHCRYCFAHLPQSNEGFLLPFRTRHKGVGP